MEEEEVVEEVAVEDEEAWEVGEEVVEVEGEEEEKEMQTLPHLDREEKEKGPFPHLLTEMVAGTKKEMTKRTAGVIEMTDEQEMIDPLLKMIDLVEEWIDREVGTTDKATGTTDREAEMTGIDPGYPVTVGRLTRRR